MYLANINRANKAMKFQQANSSLWLLYSNTVNIFFKFSKVALKSQLNFRTLTCIHLFQKTLHHAKSDIIFSKKNSNPLFLDPKCKRSEVNNSFSSTDSFAQEMPSK